ncbi:condensin-2 complex subunit H2 [Scomber japonicus]|uniref:condensin-2 complex subunit H2 n=1 Tax=Scomber japonicus TaxID=13676 RepID=UPI0023059002|nr:condensin-2 complex subunit H2 [Scomber japonicus]
MESTENRYAHLLQPIRELTKNWEIDVASELNDYLDELDDMCITFDGGKTRLNFAEAALLIQGSTCIYSKKVELLHNLVFQTLEYINDRNKKRNKQAAAEGGDADRAASKNNDADDDDDEAVFTPLDIDVTEKSQTGDSNATVSVVPLPPASLIPPDTREKQKLPLINVKGDVVCSQKDFRINLFIPGDREMILLTRGSSADRYLLIDQQQQQRVPDAAPLMEALEDDAAENFLPLDDNGMDLDQDQGQSQNQDQDQNQNQDQDQDPEEHVERHQAPGEGRMIRERRQLEEKKQEEAPPALNIWALHDPYAVLAEDKPFKSGKCYKVPDGLDDGGKRKRKRACSLLDFRSWFRGTFDPPAHKLKNGPSFTDLNYVYLSTMKDKLKTRKRIYRRAGVMVSDEELRRTFLQPEEPEQQPGGEPVDGFRHPELLGADDENSDDEHEAFPDEFPAELVGGPDFISPEVHGDELSYEDLVKLRVEQLVVNSRGYTQETGLSRRVKDWEAKIRPELAQQEERPVFDIHSYSDRIVSSLSDVGRRRSFAAIVHGLDNYEACKYLLASLQLANDRTVDIDSAEGLEESVDSMGLTLLSTYKATDRFKKLASSS